jgi:ABC-type amino acid transport substrate-binding protein
MALHIIAMSGVLNIVLVFFFTLSALSNPLPQNDPHFHTVQTLKVGWQDLYPYQYSRNAHGHETVMGLDIELIRAVSDEIHKDPAFTHCTWERLLQLLKTGQLDMGLNAIKMPERLKDFWISDPVRKESTVL